jgi:hypothetical protein
LNGYKATSNTLEISVSPTNLVGTKITVKITFGSTTTVTSVWLSYFAFVPANAPFGSYGGLLS